MSHTPPPFGTAIASPRRAYRWTVGVLISGLLLTLGAWFTQRGIESRAHQSQFDQAAGELHKSVEQRFERCERLLLAVALWAESAQRSDPAAWQRMAQRLGVGGADWCSDALSWYPRVEAAGIGAFVQARRDAGETGYALRPAGARELYFPLAFSTPPAAISRRFLGIDPWADPRRRAQLDIVSTRGGLSASPIQAFTPDTRVVLRYVAVRRGPAPQDLLGFIGAPLRMEVLVQQFQALQPTLRLRISDLDDQGQRLYATSPPNPAVGANDADVQGRVRTLAHAGREWRVEIEALPAFHPFEVWPLSLVLLLCGLGITVLATGLTASLVRSDARARALALRYSRTAIEQREQALRAEAQRRLLVELVPIGVIHIGPDHCIVSANRAAHEMLGYDDDTLIGVHVATLHDAAEVERRCAELSRLRGVPVQPSLALFAAMTSNDGHPIEAEWTLVRRDGTRFPAAINASQMFDHEGRPFGSVRVFTDISERHRNTEQIKYLALHDRLTGLPNRLHLEDWVREALVRAEQGGRGFALMLLDLDRFKQVNDTLGHPVGDQVLQGVAQRLLACVRTTDTVARMGGDEFVVLLPDVDLADEAMQVARKLIEGFRDDIVVPPHRLLMTTSIGIALYPASGTDMASLLKAADLAMYRAKADGRNIAVVYDPLEHAPDAHRLQLERDLRDALTARQLQIYFQPLVDARSGEPVAVEALLRWRHPVFGAVPPSEFIPLAEETGEIVAIGDWVLRGACKALVQLRERWPALRMAVNISAVQLGSVGFEASVEAALAGVGLAPEALELELTESVLVRSPMSAGSCLQRLREKGVGLAVDDFGTGYSALAYLSRFPVTTLKVDRSFVCQIDAPTSAEAPSDGGALASAIIAMARTLGLHTVAEGVETEAQVQFLRAAGCDMLQGYLFSHAVPIERLGETFERLSAQRAVAG